MYTKLAEGILGRLPVTAEAQRKEEPLPADKDLRLRLRAVKTFDDLLDALRALEFVVSARNALYLSRYSWTTPLEKQDDHSEAVRTQALVLYRAYRNVAARTGQPLAAGLPMGANDPAAVSTAKADLRALAPRITVDVGANHPGTGDFLRTVREVLLLSLAAATRGVAGQNLLAMLAGDQRVRIIVDLRYKGSPSSLLAYGPDGTVAAYANPAAPAVGTVPAVHKGAGSHSHFGAPVWVDDGDILQLAPTLFTKHLTLDRALERILLGSLSFGEGKYAFYSPPRIELMHEMLHVAHNGDGVNRAAVPLPKGITPTLWTNTEEYSTIAAGDLTENHFGAEIGLPDRYGHGGLTLDFLQRTSAAAVDSLAVHSRIP